VINLRVIVKPDGDRFRLFTVGGGMENPVGTRLIKGGRFPIKDCVFDNSGDAEHAAGKLQDYLNIISTHFYSRKMLKREQIRVETQQRINDAIYSAGVTDTR
jgi:hypothetical protein